MYALLLGGEGAEGQRTQPASIHSQLPSIQNGQVALAVKNPPANAGESRDADSTQESGRPPGGGNGNPLQYSCLGNPMERRAQQATDCGVAKSRTLKSVK